MLNSLQGKLTLLFIAFALIVLVSVSATMRGLEAQRQDALVINLAGRQRMLAQQMARLSAESRDLDDDSYASLLEAEQTFEQTQRALCEGGSAPYLSNTSVTLPSARNPKIRAALADVNRTWNETRSSLDSLHTAPLDDPSHSEKLQAIEKNASLLVEQADLVVRLYEADSTAKINRLRQMQYGFLLSALILLGMGAWITRKSTLEPLKELAQAARRLGGNDLDSAVQVEGPSEIRTLSDAFEGMRASLLSSRNEWVELNDSLERRVAQRTRELDALNEVSREIALQLDVNYVLKSVAEKARMLLDGESARLCLLGERKQRLHLQAASGLLSKDANSEYSASAAQASAVLGSSRALICEDAHCMSGCGSLDNAHAASHAVAPLRIGEKVIGALCVSSSRANHFTGESAELLTKLANTAAIALHNAQLYAQAERLATLEERHRVATEMHDGLGQTLGYLGLMADQTMELLANSQGEAALERLRKTRETVEKATGDVRRAINNLMDESPAEFPLRERLQDAVNTLVEETRLPVTMQAEVSPRCSRQVAEQIVNVTREALSNAARHADAKRIALLMGQTDGHYFIKVEDDGKGFDCSQPEPNGHFGLKIMQARAEHIGGHVVVDSMQGRGTRVTLTWPAEVEE